jgi:hypothetical protein
MLAFPVLLMLVIASRPVHFPRYALSLVPFIALAGGDLLDRCVRVVSERLPGRGAVVAAGTALAVALICVPSLLNDLRYSVYLNAPDTREQALQWIETNLPAGTTITGEGGQSFEAMSNLGVPVRPDPAAVKQTWIVPMLNPKDDFWEAPLLSWLETYTPTYKLTFAPTITMRGEVTTTQKWGNPEAFIMISWRSDPEAGTPPTPFWEELRRDYQMAARFDCVPCFPEDPYAWALDYRELAKVDPLWGQTVAGPRVWVYTRRAR